MAKAEARRDQEVPASRVPRPVPGGTERIESLGWLIDDVLMGHARTERRIAQEMEGRLLREDEMPEDPPPAEAPPPVPDGDEPVTKGDEPDGETRE